MITQLEQKSEISVSCSLISQNEVEKMAEILRKRYGIHAYATAVRFAKEHVDIDDETHADAWARVARHLFETTNIR